MLRVRTISAVLKATSEFWSCNDPYHLKIIGRTVSAVHIIKSLENEIEGKDKELAVGAGSRIVKADAIRAEAQSS